jgi:uncharacterized protein DUF5712
MYVKIQASGKGGNSGSCSEYASYLEKENDHKPEHEKEHFFNSDRENVKVFEVIHEIDKNKKAKGKDEANFYSIILSPSQDELKHIGNNNDKLKEFTRSAMDEYAKNFNKGLEGKDLLYFAKLEHERKYKGNDIEVERKEKEQGEQKQGDQRHIHVIVSRRAKEKGAKVCPVIDSKGHKMKVRATGRVVNIGFDRQQYYTAAEKTFDKQTDFSRSIEDTYLYKLEQSKLTHAEKIKQSYEPKEIDKTPLEQARENQQERQEQKEQQQQQNKELGL